VSLRILVHDYSGHPFQLQLSRALAERGHEVLHLYSSDFQTGQGATTVTETDPPTLSIEPVGIGLQFAKYNPIRRGIHELRFGRVLRRRVKAWQPEVVLSSNTPLLTQAMLLSWVAPHKVPFVFWLQDVYSLLITEALEDRFGKPGAVVGSFFGWLERRMLRMSDGVVAITEDFGPILRRWKVDRDRIRAIANWAPLAELPMVSRHNEWAHEFGIADEFVFLYSGTIGHKHRPDLLLRLADEIPDATVLVVSEGLGITYLRDACDKLPRRNLRLLPFQPYERLPEVLGSGDALIAVLEPDAGVYSVPSKVLSYLCAGRPILASMPIENLAARTLVGNEAGKVAAPNDDDAFIAHGIELFESSELRRRLGKSARTYAEQTFDIDSIADQFTNALVDAIAVRTARNSN